MARRWPFVFALLMIGAAAVWGGMWIFAPDRDLESLERRIEIAHRVFNGAEGMFWCVVGIGLLRRAAHRPDPRRGPLLLAGVVCIAFGVSDFVEVETGAWYAPSWLLAWNVGCVVSLVTCGLWYYRVKG